MHNSNTPHKEMIDAIVKATTSLDGVSLSAALVGTKKAIFPNICLRSPETVSTLNAMLSFAYGVYIVQRDVGTALYESLITSLATLDNIGRNAGGMALVSTDAPFSLYFIVGTDAQDKEIPSLMMYDLNSYSTKYIRLRNTMNGAVILHGARNALEHSSYDGLCWSVHT